jgi:hypothetical protein
MDQRILIAIGVLAATGILTLLYNDFKRHDKKCTRHDKKCTRHDKKCTRHDKKCTRHDKD